MDKKVIKIVNYSEFLEKKKITLPKQKFNRKTVNVKIPGRLSFAGGGLDFTDILINKSINILSVSVDKFIKIKIQNRKDYKIKVFIKKKNSLILSFFRCYFAFFSKNVILKTINTGVTSDAHFIILCEAFGNKWQLLKLSVSVSARAFDMIPPKIV